MDMQHAYCHFITHNVSTLFIQLKWSLDFLKVHTYDLMQATLEVSVGLFVFLSPIMCQQ